MPNKEAPPQQKISQLTGHDENAAPKKSTGTGLVISVVLLLAVFAAAVYFYI